MKFIEKILSDKEINRSELESSFGLAIQELIKLKDEQLFIKVIKSYSKRMGWKRANKSDKTERLGDDK